MAAYLFSVGCCADCLSVDLSILDASDARGHLRLQETEACLTQRIQDSALADGQERSYRQKHYSRLIDAKKLKDLESSANSEQLFRAHLALQAAEGTGAWLTAFPADDDTSVDPALFRICLQRRLRQRVLDRDCICSLCGSTMDSYGDHALVCSCGGDRATRHNVLRNAVYSVAMGAALGQSAQSRGCFRSGLLRTAFCAKLRAKIHKPLGC